MYHAHYISSDYSGVLSVKSTYTHLNTVVRVHSWQPYISNKKEGVKPFFLFTKTYLLGGICMYYGYGIWREIFNELQRDNSFRLLRNYQKHNQVTKAIQNKEIPKDKPFLFLRFSKGDQKLQDKLQSEGYQLFPNPEFSQFIRDREYYLQEIDQLTKYPLKRMYFPHFDISIKQGVNDYFGYKTPVVVKVGNLHASEGKYLVTETQPFPYLKYDQRKQSITVEEFVPNARSIRIGLIGDPTSYENYFIHEHINSKTWLKNFAPEEELVYSYNERHQLNIPEIDSLFEEVQMIAQRYNANLLGVDWVVTEDKIGLLELNDMIGLPEGDFAKNLFLTKIRDILLQSI